MGGTGVVIVWYWVLDGQTLQHPPCVNLAAAPMHRSIFEERRDVHLPSAHDPRIERERLGIYVFTYLTDVFSASYRYVRESGKELRARLAAIDAEFSS